MSLGRGKILAAFLEGDNLKLIAYDRALSGKLTRLFAGQLTFPPEVLREGFIADAGRFASQVKIAFAQKELLREVEEVTLFLPADKTFTKTIPASDSVESFVRSLPYFKEELIVNLEGKRRQAEAGEVATYAAFEKKLVEDFSRPFLEAGRKIAGVKSAAVLLAGGFAQPGKYLFLVSGEKELTAAAAEGGMVAALGAFKMEAAAGRLGDFASTHNLAAARQAFILGRLPEGLWEKIRPGEDWTVTTLSGEDVYDLAAGLAGGRRRLWPFGGVGEMGGKVKVFLALFDRRVLAAAAVAAGVFLVIFAGRQLFLRSEAPAGEEEAVSPVPSAVPLEAPPVSAGKPADYPVRVLNGTLVAGEAARLAEKLKEAGYPVTETANATASGFVATRLRPVSGVSEKTVAELKTLLLETYEAVTVEAGADLLEGAKIEIVIGSKRGT